MSNNDNNSFNGKYANLEQSHIFQPLAFENLRTISETCFDFIFNIGNTISTVTSNCLSGSQASFTTSLSYDPAFQFT